MGKTCVICGKPSGMYPLCKEHLQMKNEGKVIKCEDCGAWHLKDEPCPNCDVKYFKSLTDKIKNERRKCLFCGNDTEDGQDFRTGERIRNGGKTTDFTRLRHRHAGRTFGSIDNG